MLSPIPNSQGVGLGLDFFPHGMVTATLAAQVELRIEICVIGVVEPIFVASARVDSDLVLAAGIVDQLPITGEVLQFQNVNGDVITTLTLTGIIEDC